MKTITQNQFGYQKVKPILYSILTFHSVISKVFNSGDKLFVFLLTTKGVLIKLVDTIYGKKNVIRK